MHRISFAVLLACGCAFGPGFAAQTNSTPSAQPAASTKRPMTFEDMMQMKRLGETAVSPDGKWLAYSVTTVDLDQNTKTTELWLQAIDGGEPFKIGVAEPGDSGVQFAPDGHSVLFLSGRVNGQQIWLADFDPATGATSNAKKLTAIATEADNAKWSPDGQSMVFTSGVYPDCPADHDGGFRHRQQCNADRDKALAASKVKAQIFTHSALSALGPLHRRQAVPSVSGFGGDGRDARPESRGHARCAAVFARGPGCGCAFSPDSKELAFTVKDRSRPSDLDQCGYLHARPDRSGGQAGEGEHVAGRGFLSGVLAGWEVSGVAVAGAGGI